MHESGQLHLHKIISGNTGGRFFSQLPAAAEMCSIPKSNNGLEKNPSGVTNDFEILIQAIPILAVERGIFGI